MSLHYDKRSISAIAPTIFVADTERCRSHAAIVLSSADLFAAIHALRDEGKMTNADLGRLLTLPSSRIAEIFDGKRKLSVDEAKAIVEHFRLGMDAESERLAEPDIDMVGIQMIDLAYGLGATYHDSAAEVEVVHFPKVWVQQITHSSPAHLTWTQGRGDSMSPTIEDGDMVLLDRSQTKVEEQDAMWAFAIGDINAIKRLRVKGDRYQILSDNPNVPPDEEPQDFVRIVARVVFVGRRK